MPEVWISRDSTSPVNALSGLEKPTQNFSGSLRELYRILALRIERQMRACRPLFLILCGVALFASSNAAAQDKVATTTVCDVVKDPARFDNKFVRLVATLAGNFEYFIDPRQY